MSAQSTHVAAVMTAIEGLGYKLSKDNFDFDSVPSTVMDKAYRWEISLNEVREVSGNRVEKVKTMDLWVAYKLTAAGDRKAAVLAMLNNIEAVEDLLLKTLSTLPSLVVKTSMSKYMTNYIVFSTSLDFTYWRDL